MQDSYAVIVAGGSGTRMKTTLPKQFLLLAGEPLLMRTLRTFSDFTKIVLVLPQSQISYWHELCVQYGFSLPHTVVAGGTERFYSVKNALDCLHGGGLVAIHDGVRPFVDKSVIGKACDVAKKFHAAVPVVPIVDSLRKLPDGGKASFSVNRKGMFAVQTPQVFDLQMLKAAYECEWSAGFTDDASVFEAYGNKVELSEGSRFNFKITTAEDLQLAEALINAKIVF